MIDPKLQTSFIPRKPLEQAVAPAVEKPKAAPSSFFLVVGLVVFGIVVAGSLAVLGYNAYLKSRLNTLTQTLNNIADRYSPALASELIRLNDRIENSRKLLSQHLAPSLIFSFLEQTTLEKVQFKSFSYSFTGEGRTGKILISAKGKASDFEAIALQSDAFSKDKRILEPIFSDFEIDKTGAVNFNFAAMVDWRAVSYKEAISAGSSAPITQNN